MDLQAKLKNLVELEFQEVYEKQVVLMRIGSKHGKRKDFGLARKNFDRQFSEG